MLKAKNIIYGFCTFTNPPKNKYLISLYRSETLNVVAVFPTSRKRSGSLSPKHGKTTEDRILYHTYLKQTGALERSMVLTKTSLFHWLLPSHLIIASGKVNKKTF